MLTKDDLNLIRQIVREEVEVVVARELKPVEKKIDVLDKKINKVQKSLDETISLFDRDYIALKRRVKRVEDILFYN